MAPVILYHCAPSTPSRATLLAIRNLDIDVEIKVINLHEKQQNSPEFLKINPQHTVPTLDDNGFILWESRAIMSYLANSRAPGSSLYPSDPKQRALVDQRLYFDIGTLSARIGAIAYPAMFAGQSKIPDDKRKSLNDGLTLLNTFLEGNEWVAGKNLTLADFSLLSTVGGVYHAGLDLSKYPNIAKWYGKAGTLPGWEECDEGGKFWGNLVKSKLEDKL